MIPVLASNDKVEELDAQRNALVILLPQHFFVISTAKVVILEAVSLKHEAALAGVEPFLQELWNIQNTLFMFFRNPNLFLNRTLLVQLFSRCQSSLWHLWKLFVETTPLGFCVAPLCCMLLSA